MVENKEAILAIRSLKMADEHENGMTQTIKKMDCSGMDGLKSFTNGGST